MVTGNGHSYSTGDSGVSLVLRQNPGHQIFMGLHANLAHSPRRADAHPAEESVPTQNMNPIDEFR